MADLVKVQVEVPVAAHAVVEGVRKVVADVAKTLADGWQPWGDTTAVVQSVMTNLPPVAPLVSKIPGEFAAYPAETARLACLVLADVVGLALKKVRG